MTTITPDDRDALRALADEYEDSTIDGGPDAAAGAIRRLLDALDQAEAERDHARAQVDRVRELHRPLPLYDHEDTCPDTSDEHREEHHRQGCDIGEFYCDQRPVGSECAECRDDDGDHIDWPCPTIRASGR